MGDLRFEREALSGVPIADIDRILDKVNWLWDNRTLVIHHPLKHDLSGLFKRVFGKYRIIYGYDNDPDLMTVYMVGTRDQIYKDAVKKFHQ